MHLMRIALSSLSLSSLQAVRSGGTSGSRPTSLGCTQASLAARRRHGSTSSVEAQPIMRISHLALMAVLDTLINAGLALR
eukprot:33598-Pleurochrysis_carterae.AAC.1